jgi:hypothetical protein
VASDDNLFAAFYAVEQGSESIFGFEGPDFYHGAILRIKLDQSSFNSRALYQQFLAPFSGRLGQQFLIQ